MPKSSRIQTKIPSGLNRPLATSPASCRPAPRAAKRAAATTTVRKPIAVTSSTVRRRSALMGRSSTTR